MNKKGKTYCLSVKSNSRSLDRRNWHNIEDSKDYRITKDSLGSRNRTPKTSDKFKRDESSVMVP